MHPILVIDPYSEMSFGNNPNFDQSKDILPSQNAKIEVIGVGGGGSNAVNRMINSDLGVYHLESSIPMHRHYYNLQLSKESNLDKTSLEALEQEAIQVSVKRLQKNQEMNSNNH